MKDLIGLVMCNPSEFDVQYTINPWMTDHINALNKATAKAQWNTLYNILKKEINVEVIEPVKGLLDMVFVANAALAIGNKVCIANFKHTERQQETVFWHSWFSAKEYETLSLPNRVYFEGEGDALYDQNRDCIWGGCNKRSAKEAYPYIEKFFDIEALPLELVDDRFYHLDTCFSVLPHGYVLYAYEAFSKDSLALIESRVQPEYRLPITLEEASMFSCNTVSLGENIVCNAVSTRIKHELLQRDITVREVALSEFMKSGGASKCLVLSHYSSK